MKTISASEANRQFSKLLREVAEGEDVSIVSHGRTVAKIVSAANETRDREMARSSLVARLSRQAATGQRDWTRADLYD
ncbi:MAG: type II toxin-antitoxin system Phd/YefM family antitoxin [Hyphomonas sp.]